MESSVHVRSGRISLLRCRFRCDASGRFADRNQGHVPSTIIDGMENTSTPTGDTVRESYSARSREYVELFGSMPSSSWAATVTGPVLDAGCGPGQWTDFLAARGPPVSGIDLVPEFVERTRMRYPDLTFHVGRFEASGSTESLGGVLVLAHSPRSARHPDSARRVRARDSTGRSCWWASSTEQPWRLSTTP